MQVLVMLKHSIGEVMSRSICVRFLRHDVYWSSEDNSSRIRLAAVGLVMIIGLWPSSIITRMIGNSTRYSAPVARNPAENCLTRPSQYSQSLASWSQSSLIYPSAGYESDSLFDGSDQSELLDLMHRNSRRRVKARPPAAPTVYNSSVQHENTVIGQAAEPDKWNRYHS